MYLLYSDESGEITNPADRVLVVAGIAVHEDAIRPLAGAVNETTNRYIGQERGRGIEIHGSPMRGGRGEWKGIGRAKRQGLMAALLDQIDQWQHENSGTTIQTFAAVVDRDHSQSPIETAYGEFLFAFDRYLRTGRRQGQPHNGVLVTDRGKYERTLRAWVEVARARYRRPRQDERRLYALVETPFFVDSRSTRLMQLADLVSFSFFRAYNSDDWTLAERLLPSMRTAAEKRLIHLTGDASCRCPACGLAT